MRNSWMALLSVVLMTGSGTGEGQQPQDQASSENSEPRRSVLAAGYSHSLALNADGTVWAWGINNSGQLGDGTFRKRPQPVKVVGLDGVKRLTAGDSHALALREDGTVWAWGDNTYGQLGRPRLPDSARPRPAQVPGLTNVVDIAAGKYHSLALREDGTVWAWGSNFTGELGRPTNHSGNPTPEQVPALSGVVAVTSAESYSLALREDGTVWAWGSNQGGPPGLIQVQGLTGVVALSTGGAHSLVVREDGTVWAWDEDKTPARVPGLTNVVDVAAGYDFSLALIEDGTVWAWGGNHYGQRGDGTWAHRSTPQQVDGLKQVISLEAAEMYALAMRQDGTVWGWGRNHLGQLGTGPELRTTPAQVQGLADAGAVSTHYSQSTPRQISSHSQTKLGTPPTADKQAASNFMGLHAFRDWHVQCSWPVAPGNPLTRMVWAKASRR